MTLPWCPGGKISTPATSSQASPVAKSGAALSSRPSPRASPAVTGTSRHSEPQSGGLPLAVGPSSASFPAASPPASSPGPVDRAISPPARLWLPVLGPGLLLPGPLPGALAVLRVGLVDGGQELLAALVVQAGGVPDQVPQDVADAGHHRAGSLSRTGSARTLSASTTPARNSATYIRCSFFTFAS